MCDMTNSYCFASLVATWQCDAQDIQHTPCRTSPQFTPTPTPETALPVQQQPNYPPSCEHP